MIVEILNTPSLVITFGANKQSRGIFSQPFCHWQNFPIAKMVCLLFVIFQVGQNRSLVIAVLTMVTKTRPRLMKLKICVRISFVITELAGIPSFYNTVCYLELFLAWPGLLQAQPVDSVKSEIPPHGCLERAIFASVFEATLLLLVASQLAKSVGLVVTHVT